MSWQVGQASREWEVAAQEERRGLTRRARTLTGLGLGWDGLEAAVAILAGVVAWSVALTAFGAPNRGFRSHEQGG